MASLAYSSVVSDAPTPALLTQAAATDPANDNAPSWLADPRAKLLLASCVAIPPAVRQMRQRYGNSVDRWSEYVGYRAEALETIRMEYGERAHLAYQDLGEDAYPAFDAWCREPNATDAIHAALNPAFFAVRKG